MPPDRFGMPIKEFLGYAELELRTIYDIVIVISIIFT